MTIPTQKLKDHSTELRDEQLSKRPATALPWRTLKEPQDKERRCRVLAAEGGVAILCVNRQLGDPGPSKAELQNAEYITHAANSYPRLVEALKRVEAMFGSTDDNDIAGLRTLLKDLGEFGGSE